MAESGTTSGFYNMTIASTKYQAAAGDELSYSGIVQSVRATFDSGKTKSLTWRKQQLNQIKKLVIENHLLITEAIRKDHGGPKLRGLFDFGGTVTDADAALANLDAWTAPEPVKNDSFLGKSYVRKEPKGVVLIMAPWNFPFAMVFDAMVPIIAAGNCAIVKPSEVSVHTCALIADLIPKYLDTSAIKVVTGGVAETTALLREKFDHIMYTGNGAVARIVMEAASKNLTPVTLELGGKSPVYVDKSAKLDLAVIRIVQAKLMNVGQICIAPDYILVHEAVADQFKQKVVEKVKELWGETTEDRKNNSDYGKIINQGHVARINNILKDSIGEVLMGGPSESSERFFDPTIVATKSDQDKLLKEELFGPVLPILAVSNVIEAAQKVSVICKQPLALYVFAENQQTIDTFLNNTTSGGVCINSTLEHINNRNLPFGGIGESGTGRYHGKWGFDEFSHFRGVLVKDTMVSRGATFPLPPYKDGLYDIAVKLTVTGFLTDSQRTVLKYGGAAAAASIGYVMIRSRM